ncbi:MAG: MarR family winged helix-turn-helix transcriptional regulator [Acidimicrobiales bacterium]
MAQPSQFPAAPTDTQAPGHAGQTGGTHETAFEAVRSFARAARLLERAAGDLGMAQYRVLCAIAAGDERASRVAERFGLGKPTVSAAVDSLCRQGLLSRKSSEGDHRATDLAITAAGASRLADAEIAMVAVLDELRERAPTPSAVLTVLASLGPALDAMRSDRSTQLRASRT